MVRGDPPTSPWIYEESGFPDGHVTIHVEVNFNNSTFALTNPALTGTRSADCPWTKVQVGAKTFAIPVGNFTVSRTAMNNQGFSTIQDVTDSGFTLTN